MTAFNIDSFTTSGAPDLAFGTRGEITTTFPHTTLGARATTVRVEPPGTSWSAAGPLFRTEDRDSMMAAFDPFDYEDVAEHAGAIVGTLRSGQMPRDGAWPAAHVDKLQQLIAGEGASMCRGRRASRPCARAGRWPGRRRTRGDWHV